MKIIESDFIYKGYRCVTTFMDTGYRCGYVGLEKTHPLYGKGMNSLTKATFADIEDQPFGKRSPLLMFNLISKHDEPVSLDFYFDVHGGITYADGNGKHPVESDLWWLGFDCGHAGDARDIETLKATWPDTERTQYLLMNDLTFEDDVVRTKEYVQEECKSLVDQIIDYCEKYEKEE